MTVKKDTYYIAHNNAEVVHHGFVQKGKALDTGQPELETFDNEADYLKRLKELGVKPETDK